MRISLMKRGSTLKKKISLHLLLIIIGLIVFFLGMLSFIINACTTQNVSIAWLFFAFIILGSGSILTGLIMFLLKNKDNIKKYLDNLM